MKNYLSKLHSWQLAIISGVLIGKSFHQIWFGILVYIGFIPLMHSWIRKNSNLKFDKDGILASRGTRNDIIFEQAQELFGNRPNKKTLSLDVCMMVFLQMVSL